MYAAATAAVAHLNKTNTAATQTNL